MELTHRAGDYAVMHFSDLPEQLRDDLPEDCFAVVLLEGERVVQLIGWDGGEPEDQLLCRDWSWVVVALDKAYRRGYDCGRGDYGNPNN